SSPGSPCDTRTDPAPTCPAPTVREGSAVPGPARPVAVGAGLRAASVQVETVAAGQDVHADVEHRQGVVGVGLGDVGVGGRLAVDDIGRAAADDAKGPAL